MNIFLFVIVHVTTDEVIVGLLLAGPFLAIVVATYGKFTNGQQSYKVVTSFKSLLGKVSPVNFDGIW